MREILEPNRRSLEEEFFSRQNQQLTQKLKEEQLRIQTHRELEQISGISDQQVLDQLISMGVSASTLVALTHVPLVMVAWADGTIDPAERTAICRALEEQGFDSSNPSYELLLSWLEGPPNRILFDTWKSYVKGLRQSMNEQDFGQMKSDIMERTLAVAEAAGGFLGLGSKISSAEREQFRLLEEAFVA